MRITTDHDGREAAIAALFAATFTDSEGAPEGGLIGALVQRLMATTDPADLRVVLASDEDGTLTGAILLTRLIFEGDARAVFLLAPVAVRTDRQGTGIGQALIARALSELAAEGVAYSITYGDPAYYGRCGYAPIDMDFAPPPLPLSQPEGWLGQPLGGAVPAPFPGPCRCVPAFEDPAFW